MVIDVDRREPQRNSMKRGLVRVLVGAILFVLVGALVLATVFDDYDGALDVLQVALIVALLLFVSLQRQRLSKNNDSSGLSGRILRSSSSDGKLLKHLKVWQKLLIAVVASLLVAGFVELELHPFELKRFLKSVEMFWYLGGVLFLMNRIQDQVQLTWRKRRAQKRDKGREEDVS